MEKEKYRMKFNPKGSMLRDQQEVMFYLLTVIDEICKKNGLSYWLSSGTLLGAVRHGGFIPWDDDLDIEMLKEDYERLISIISKEGLPEDIILQHTTTDKRYVFPFAKIRYKKSRIQEHTKKIPSLGFDGIFIDIFPIEKSYKPIAKFSNRVIGWAFYNFVDLPSDSFGIKNFIENLSKWIMNKCIFPPLRWLTLKLHKEEYGHALGMPFLASNPRYLSEIFPLREIMFEGRLFPCPTNYDAYLKRLYGNYMQIPSIDSINKDRGHTTNVSIEKTKDILSLD